MTDRVHSITVILETPLREDDIEGLTTAISRLRGVAKTMVTPENVVDYKSEMALERARAELRAGLAELLWPSPKPR